MKIIDISRDVLNTDIYPGDPEPHAEFVSRIGENGSECNLSTLFSCVHTGTHADAPLHFVEGGDSVDALPIEAFIGPCTVIEAPAGAVTGEFVDENFPENCERILIKGGGEAYFLGCAAEAAAGLGIKLIGTDSLSVGTKGAQTAPHKAFLLGGVNILEGLKLDEVEPGNYFLFAPPVKLGGLEGAPARAILISDYIFWSGNGDR